MNLEVTIKEFLRIRDAKIPLPEKTVVIYGGNASGKTSVAIAIAGILSRNTNPLKLGKKKGTYLNNKADRGEVVLTDADNGTEYRRWLLQDDTMRVLNDSPDIGGSVLGMVDFIELTPTARAEQWEGCFLPDNETLLSMVGDELLEMIGKQAVVDEVLEMLAKKPWKDAENVYAHKSKEAKRVWERLAGESYGPVKADRWNPRDWKSEYDTVTPAEVKTRLEEAKEAYRMVQVGQAVSEAEMGRAEAARDELPNLKWVVQELSDTYNQDSKPLDVKREAAEKVLQEAEEKYGKIKVKGLGLKKELERHEGVKPKEKEETTPCPHCGEPILVGSDRSLNLADNEGAVAAILKAWEFEKDGIEEKLATLRTEGRALLNGEVAPARTEVQDLNKKLLEIRDYYQTQNAKAKTILEQTEQEAKLSETGKVVAAEDVRKQADAEQVVDDSKAAVTMIQTRADALAAHANVTAYSAIRNALGSKGIRARAMTKAMERVNAGLMFLSGMADWPVVEVDSSYQVSVEGFPGVVTAGSWCWRANMMIAATIAYMNKQPRMIADAADILDAHPDGVPGMIKICQWLEGTGTYPIICATDTLKDLPEEWPVVVLKEGRGNGDKA